RDELGRRFFAAADRGDTDGLIQMLAADVVAYGDTGGTGLAFPRPIHGRDKVIRLLPAFSRLAREAGLHMEMAEVNGQPGCKWVDEEGRLGAVVSIDIADDQVQAVRSVSNPDKLRHLGAVSPVTVQPRNPRRRARPAS